MRRYKLKQIKSRTSNRTKAVLRKQLQYNIKSTVRWTELVGELKDGRNAFIADYGKCYLCLHLGCYMCPLPDYGKDIYCHSSKSPHNQYIKYSASIKNRYKAAKEMERVLKNITKSLKRRLAK